MKKIIAKAIGYVVPSLAAAGAVSADLGGFDSSKVSAPLDSLKDAKSIVSNFQDNQVFTLAGHSSHASHGSHGSHGSHSSHSSSGLILEQIDESEQRMAINGLDTGARNEASTPRSTVLPSSPAIAKHKKLKILPGNSKKFTEVVTQVQIALGSRGYDIGAVNGEYHARTIAAIYEYQAARGIPATGKITPETLSSLGIIAG